MNRKIVSFKLPGVLIKKCFEVSEKASQELNARRSRGRRI